MSDEEGAKCRLAKLIVDGPDGKPREIPIAVCQLGEKVDLRVPDKKLLAELFEAPKKESAAEQLIAKAKEHRGGK